eukprot:scpid10140/ scgid32507/ Double zinc ribbon and ankyrin repeat-containing protein 1
MAAGSVLPPTIVPLRTPDQNSLGKQYITTNTPIELKTVTPGAQIYFTIDGTRPEPNQRFGQKTTMQYTGPIYLSPGKQMLKAIAVDRQERQSATVTKTFFVSFSDDDVDDGGEAKQASSARALSKSGPPLHSTSASLMDQFQQTTRSTGLASNMLCSRPSTGGAHFLSARLDKSRASTSDSTSPKELRPASVQRPQTPAEVQQLGQDTGYLKCVYCFAQRPADPFSRFCGECGSPMPSVPPRRASPPEAGELGKCLYCHSMVPLNAPRCMVCDAPMQPQLQPQAAKRLQRRIICVGCGMANPPEMSVCVACESELTGVPREITIDEVIPEELSGPKIAPVCHSCDRQLALDSRFCDGCGGKVVDLASSAVVCSLCNASNSAQYRCCTSCGASLRPDQATKHDPGASTTSVDGGKKRTKDGSWLIVPPPKPPGQLKTQACQTEGLFFPSAKAIENMKGSEVEKIMSHLTMQDRATRDLTQTSPGRGYWRQQTDHICAHIKAYSQNSPDFQSAIGQPLMGRVLAATARQEDHELTLTFTFDLKSLPETGSRSVSRNGTFSTSAMSRSGTPPTSRVSSSSARPASAGASLSGLLLASSGYDRLTGTTSQSSQSIVGRSTRSFSVAAAPTRKKAKTTTKLRQSPEDCLLLRELADQDGTKDRVLQLLREGASPNCRDRQSLPALSVAASNGRADCLCALVDTGAKIQQQDVNGNTALHAAIVKGSNQTACVEELLRCGINPDLRNKLGQTAYDVAVHKHIQPLIRCLATNVGTQLLAPRARTRNK